MSSRRTSLSIALTVGLLASACGGSDDPVVADPSSSSPAASTLAASVASADLAAGSPQRFSLGIFSSDAEGVKLLTFGQVEFHFTFLGDDSTGSETPDVTGTYLSAFGLPQGGSTPALSAPSEARGIYQAEGVVFDDAGVWQVDVTADIPDSGTQTLTATFPVGERHAIPAPGDPALHTENLTMDSIDAPASAIDSRAIDGAEVPDPELHATTIAEALDEQRPIVVIFATPTFCVSLFCGPEVDSVAELAGRYANRAVFIHVEIWRNAAKQVINQAAADWLYRNGDLTEPWVYLIGSDGVIKDRWGPLFDQDEIAAELAELPPMRS